jgi:hypothetical protein
MPAAAPAPNSLFHASVYELKMGFGDAKGQHLIYDQIFCPECTLSQLLAECQRRFHILIYFVHFYSALFMR